MFILLHEVPIRVSNTCDHHSDQKASPVVLKGPMRATSAPHRWLHPSNDLRPLPLGVHSNGNAESNYSASCLNCGERYDTKNWHQFRPDVTADPSRKTSNSNVKVAFTSSFHCVVNQEKSPERIPQGSGKNPSKNLHPNQLQNPTQPQPISKNPAESCRILKQEVKPIPWR